MASGILQQPARAAIYARVSTTNHGQDVTLQTREMGEFCQRRGWTVAEYVDVGISGTKEKRPALDRLMADAHKRRFDVVVVWRFDRFARSCQPPAAGAGNVQRARHRVCQLERADGHHDATGKMIFTVLGAVAELERSLIVERVRAGLRNARAKGKTLGQAAHCRGRRENCRLRAQGLSWAKIAAQLGVGEGTVYRLAHASAKNPIGNPSVSRYAQAAD